MKAVVVAKESFKPVVLELTFDSKESLDRFGAMCNVSFLCSVVPELREIYPVLQNAGANIINTEPMVSYLRKHFS
jgi:hypothetical protein